MITCDIIAHHFSTPHTRNVFAGYARMNGFPSILNLLVTLDNTTLRNLKSLLSGDPSKWVIIEPDHEQPSGPTYLTKETTSVFEA
jgi:hypothetical protein